MRSGMQRRRVVGNGQKRSDKTPPLGVGATVRQTPLSEGGEPACRVAYKSPAAVAKPTVAANSVPLVASSIVAAVRASLAGIACPIRSSSAARPLSLSPSPNVSPAPTSVTPLTATNDQNNGSARPSRPPPPHELERLVLRAREPRHDARGALALGRVGGGGLIPSIRHDGRVEPAEPLVHEAEVVLQIRQRGRERDGRFELDDGRAIASPGVVHASSLVVSDRACVAVAARGASQRRCVLRLRSARIRRVARSRGRCCVALRGRVARGRGAPCVHGGRRLLRGRVERASGDRHRGDRRQHAGSRRRGTKGGTDRRCVERGATWTKHGRATIPRALDAENYGTRRDPARAFVDRSARVARSCSVRR
jgi:hypothetical protein